DVAEHRSALRVAVDAFVQLSVRRRRDDEERSTKHAAAVPRHAVDDRAAGREPGHLLVRHPAAADDDGASTGEVEAGHVVVLHAPRLASRAPALPSRSTSSKSGVEIVIPYSPGPTALTVMRSSSRPESAASASF